MLLEGFEERIRHVLPLCRDFVASLVSLLCGCSVLDPSGAEDPLANSMGCSNAKSEVKFQMELSCYHPAVQLSPKWP